VQYNKNGQQNIHHQNIQRPFLRVFRRRFEDFTREYANQNCIAVFSNGLRFKQIDHCEMLAQIRVQQVPRRNRHRRHFVFFREGLYERLESFK
jgi:hypothetical protein